MAVSETRSKDNVGSGVGRDAGGAPPPYKHCRRAGRTIALKACGRGAAVYNVWQPADR